jgi:glycosyltransferase involved in cell wall biosynthesis
MRVVVTTPSPEKLGGVTNILAALKKHLSPDVEYFTVGSRTYAERPWATAWRLVRDHLAFKQRLRESRCRLVHLNPSLGPKAVIRDGLLLRAAKRAGTRVVVCFHGWDKAFESRLAGLRLALFRDTFFAADAMIVVAEEFKRALLRWGYPGPIHTLPSAIDDDLFAGDEPNGNGNTERSEIRLLFLARIEKEKGIYETLDAFALLRETRTSLRLTVAGDGPHLQALKRYARQRGISGVAFPGYLRGEEKRRCFRDADIYILPTCYGEGMPASLLEAMASGLPVVTRPVAGIKDFFVNGKMGFISESKDPRVFAEAIARLMSQPERRKEIGEYNRAYAREHFMASKVARRIEAIYEQVIRARRAHGARAGSPALQGPHVATPAPHLVRRNGANRQSSRKRSNLA